MKKDKMKLYETPVSRLVPVSTEIVFCGPSTGEAFSHQEDYSEGWSEDL